MSLKGQIKPIFNSWSLSLGFIGLLFFQSIPAQADLASALRSYQAGLVQEAVTEWENLASFGSPDAFYNLGQVYRLGLGRPKNLSHAVNLYRRAAESGHPHAQGNLAVLNYFGEGTPQNKGEAIKWWRSAARQGHGKSQYALAILYYKGEGVPQDFIQAYGWILHADQNGVDNSSALKAQMASKITPNQITQGEVLSKGLVEPSFNTNRPNMVIATEANGQPQMEVDPLISNETEREVVSSPAPSREQILENKTERTEPELEKEKPQEQEVVSAPPENKTENFNFYVQMGAFRDKTRAEALRDKLQAATDIPISHLTPFIMDVDLGSDKGVFYRLRFGGFFERGAAERLCSSFELNGQVCAVVPK